MAIHSRSAEGGPVANQAERQNPFSVLGVEPRFDLDLEQVAERHRELSRALHPDRFATAGAGERRLALSRAISVNEAWRTLKDPITRGRALLELHGVRTSEEGEPPASQALLLEVMEAREGLAEVQASGDLQRLGAQRVTFAARQTAILGEISALFAALPAGEVSLQSAEPVRRKLAELRYFQRLLSEIDELEDR